jgi:hypothetical protein
VSHASAWKATYNRRSCSSTSWRGQMRPHRGDACWCWYVSSTSEMGDSHESYVEQSNSRQAGQADVPAGTPGSSFSKSPIRHLASSSSSNSRQDGMLVRNIPRSTDPCICPSNLIQCPAATSFPHISPPDNEKSISISSPTVIHCLLLLPLLLCHRQARSTHWKSRVSRG